MGSFEVCLTICSVTRRIPQAVLNVPAEASNANLPRRPTEGCLLSSELLGICCNRWTKAHIRQVQDLEKQLLAARQQVSKLQSMVKPDTVAVEEEDDATPPQQARPNKRRRVANNYELASIQRNMRVYGRGIFRPPTAINPRSNPRSPRVSSPELPPKDLGAKLVEDYKACLHQKFPFVDWKLLSQQFDRAYRDEPVQAVHGESAAVLFGVFACGALRNHLDEGRRFFAALKLLVDFWATTPTMELIRAMLLSCLFLIETNNMSAAFSMVGHAVRAAQDIGLHHQTSATTSEEEELKRNLWLTLFCIERYDFCLPHVSPPAHFIQHCSV